ncbi:NACHT domain-containing protein [Nonomuraea zeae]|uniref:NACHT N-terminal Helical domain-containing protein n=1 Tax=Nonomuraea zeae TaxID=1642303 RepID=A0A5S4GK33_9ACTN|nr:hypothetical protein [Nonomuraea zeae]TMR33306.1 hypothetical protein ETD85_20340 [Nonomuraea zeae]
MRQILSYRDAVVLLGGDSALTGALDKASALALFGLGGIDLFDARAEAVRLGDGFIRGLRDRVNGLSRYDRTQRLTAAHTVIVISAYLEVLDEAGVLRDLTSEDQRRITRTSRVRPYLVDFPMPVPAPQHPHEDVRRDLAVHYRTLTDALFGFLPGLARWDTWDETTRTRLAAGLPARALRRYDELFRRLVADFPEVACWSDLVGHQATRAEVRSLARGLDGLHDQLAKIVSARRPSDRLAALVQANAAALKRPIVAAADAPPGMTIPSLGQGYVDPGYRVLLPGRRHLVTSEETWAELPRRDDLGAFLSGHLTLPQAAQGPLLVLGQPGAGKSLLTRVLAARLPAAEFLPLRVELRGVPADGDVLAQIEHGIKDALDEVMSWPELVHAAQGALPVVMLDGFDELLQATGVSQTDYLERVADFQRDQAEKGRALAVVVTSRTAVANRARVPETSMVLRLEPFDEGQIRQWVDLWNDGNRGYFLRRELEPLSADSVLAVPNLAEQPLLLLMLALYDADANALRLVRADLHESELYERLLRGFAAREVGKTARGLAEADLARAVEDELLRLSVAAFAMFNRGLQWIGEHDLDADLRALLPGGQEPPRPPGFRRALTRAEGVIGRFFFVHTTQALREEERLKTYEFLHATFGEYLVARLVVRELADLAEELALARSRNRPAKPDDAYLHALLSFAALAGRGPVVGFLGYGLTHLIPEDRRALLRRHLCGLFTVSLMARTGSAFDGYRPVAAEATVRCAAYSANLLLLAVLSSDGPIPGTDLFVMDRAEQANERWRRIARLWHSQLARAEWDSLVNTVRVRHFLDGATRRMEVSLDRGQPFNLRDLVFLSWPDAVPDRYPYDSPVEALAPWMREISFRDDTVLGNLFLDVLPYAKEIDPDLNPHPEHHVADLLTIVLSPEPNLETYRRALLRGPSWSYLDRVLRQLETDCHRLSSPDLLGLLHIAAVRWSGPGRLKRILWSLSARPDVDDRYLQSVSAIIANKDQQAVGIGPAMEPDPPGTPQE